MNLRGSDPVPCTGRKPAIPWVARTSVPRDWFPHAPCHDPRIRHDGSLPGGKPRLPGPHPLPSFPVGPRDPCPAHGHGRHRRELDHGGHNGCIHPAGGGGGPRDPHHGGGHHLAHPSGTGPAEAGTKESTEGRTKVEVHGIVWTCEGNPGHGIRCCGTGRDGGCCGGGGGEGHPDGGGQRDVQAALGGRSRADHW